MLDKPHGGILYQHFIARLIKEREVQTYLEIGVQNGINLSGITVDTAFGVDPDFALTVDPTVGKRALHLYRMTSDSFFRRHAEDIEQAGRIDLAFLDGMHLFEYLLRDIYNTEAHSNPNAVITIHDCLPFDGEMIERVPAYDKRTPGSYAGAWTGDVWKIVPILEKHRPDLSIHLVDCAPTGLVCISGLDPSSTVLKENYLEIVRSARDEPNDRDAISRFYDSHGLVSASDILSDFNQSLYFRV